MHIKNSKDGMGKLTSVRVDMHPTVKVRMQLRLRSQVYMLIVVLCFVVSCNTAAAIWGFASKTTNGPGGYDAGVPCTGALHKHSPSYEAAIAEEKRAGAGAGVDPAGKCADIDTLGVIALGVGIVLVGHTAMVIWRFLFAELVMLPGEKDNGASCYLRNASKEHTSTSGKFAKYAAAIIFGLELLIAAVPLSPWFYLLTLAPALMFSMTQSQKFFKM